MAGIDKTYVKKEQYYAVMKWISEQPKWRKEKLPVVRCETSDFEEQESAVLWNSTEEQDKLLMTYCDLPFIQKRLINQYGMRLRYKALYDNFKVEAENELEFCELEWSDKFLNPKQSTPDFIIGDEGSNIRFHIALGKMIMLKQLMEKEFEPIVNFE